MKSIFLSGIFLGIFSFMVVAEGRPKPEHTCNLPGNNLSILQETRRISKISRSATFGIFPDTVGIIFTRPYPGKSDITSLYFREMAWALDTLNTGIFEQRDTAISIHPRRQKAEKIAGIVIPSLMVAYGASSFFCDGIRQWDYDVDRRLHARDYIWDSNADDYIQFLPAAAAFTMKLAGVESHNNLLDMTIIYALSNALEGSIVIATKTLTARERPDSSSYNSFPSGHTATAFVAAEFLHREFGHHSVWISIGGYAAASMVGVSRIFNDRHWLSDVVAGAGIGILSTKAVYWLYPKVKGLFGKNLSAAVYPVYIHGKVGLGFSCVF